jgi:hypothetical protein
MRLILSAIALRGSQINNNKTKETDAEVGDDKPTMPMPLYYKVIFIRICLKFFKDRKIVHLNY